MKVFQGLQKDRNRVGYPGEGINQMRPYDKLMESFERQRQQQEEVEMGGAVVVPNASSPQSNVKSPLSDLLGGQALQGIANNAISYEQVSKLLQQPGQAQILNQTDQQYSDMLAQQQAAFGETLQFKREKEVRKPVVVEKRDLRARRIVLED